MTSRARPPAGAAIRARVALLLLGLALPGSAFVAGRAIAGEGAAVPAPAKESEIFGKVVLGGEPAPGVQVHAFADARGAFAGEAAASSAPTGPDGTFSLRLAPGSWFVVARGAGAGGAVFGYYGGNPVALGEGERRETNVQVVRRRGTRSEPSAGQGRTTLRGTVVGPKGPAEGASVFVYADDSRAFRGPDLFGPQGAVPGGTDASGAFEADVPPGRYYVVAVKRAGGGTLGPIKAGDLHGWFEGNPVVLAPGTALTIAIELVEKLKDQAPSAAVVAGGRAGISGRVRDAAGTVPPGVYAFATTDPNLLTGAMPPFRSRPLAPDGAYFIDLPGGATYYVGARSGFGGPPLPGEWHGFFGADRPAPVIVGRDAVAREIDVTVRRME